MSDEEYKGYTVRVRVGRAEITRGDEPAITFNHARAAFDWIDAHGEDDNEEEIVADSHDNDDETAPKTTKKKKAKAKK